MTNHTLHHSHQVMRRLCIALPLTLALLLSACGTLSDLVDPLKAHDAMAEAPEAQDPIPDAPGAVPLDDGSAWIQLVSGEWLRGKVIRIKDKKLDFKSDELGEQSISLADVLRIVSPQEQVVLTEDGRVFEGTLAADKTSLWITAGKTVQLPRNQVLTLFAVDGHRMARWTRKISLGATYRSGNTDQTDYTALAKAVRETARTRWSSKYAGAVSNVNDAETANNHRLSSKYDLWLSRRAFLTLPGVDVFRDPFQNVDVRVTPYAAIGYELVDGADHSWSISVGPAFQYQRLESQPATGEAEDSSAAGVFSTNYDWDLTSDVDLSFNYNLTVPLPDSDEYNHNAVLSLAVNLPGDLDLDIAFIWDRVNRPTADGTGLAPEPDDFRTTIGLGWSF